MALIRVELPAVLIPMMDGKDVIEIEAGATIASALDAIRAQEPRLATHLFNEQGDLREHVLCFHNDVNTRWLESLDVVIADGDRLTVMQAVSGG